MWKAKRRKKQRESGERSTWRKYNKKSGEKVVSES